MHTIQPRLRPRIQAHRIPPLQRRATTHIRNDAKAPAPNIRQHRANEAQRAKIHALHLRADLLLRRRLGGAEDGVAGVVDQDVDVRARLLQRVDDVGAAQVVNVQLEPLAAAAFAFDF